MEIFCFCLKFYQKNASLIVFFKIFAQICSIVIYKGIFKILRTSQKTFQSPLLTVLRSQKYSFPQKLQHIYRTANHGLRKPEIPGVSNRNLIVLKWQNIHVISNMKYTAIYIKRNMAKQFTLHSAKAYLEPFPMSKQAVYLIGVNYFHKKL